MSLFKKDENIECLWKVNLCEGDSEPLLNRSIVCNWNLYAKIWAYGPLNACRSRTKQREEEMKTWKANSKAWELQPYQLRAYSHGKGNISSTSTKIKMSVFMCVTWYQKNLCFSFAIIECGRTIRGGNAPWHLNGLITRSFRVVCFVTEILQV